MHPSVQQQIDVAQRNAADNPGDAELNGRLGMLLQAYDQPQAASDVYAIARLLEPDKFRWAYLQGISLTAQGSTEAAQEAYRAALVIDPEFHGTPLRLARLLADSGDTSAAYEMYQDLAQNQPDNAQVLLEYGQFLLRSGDLKLAIEKLERSIDLAGDFGLAHFSLLQAYRRSDDPNSAARHQALYETYKTVKLQISDPHWMAVQALIISDQTYIERARMMVARGRNEAAIVELRKAERFNPDNIIVHSNLIALLGSIGQIDEAGVHFERATTIDPRYAKAYTSYASALNYAGRHPDAIQALQQGIERLPENVDLRLELANTQVLSRQIDAAHEAYLAVLYIDSGNKRALMQLGRMELQQGDADSAIGYFTQAVDPEDDDSAKALRALSGVSGLKGDLDSARAFLLRALIIARRQSQHELVAKLEQDLKRIDDGTAPAGEQPIPQ